LITVKLWGSDERYETFGDVTEDLTTKLWGQGVKVSWGEKSKTSNVLLIYILGFVAVIVILLLLFKRAGKNMMGGAMSFGKTTAKLISETTKTSFADVGGCAEAKTQLADVIDFLKNPKPWVDAGVRLPRGILLEGPPGCGKTLLARAVAGETKAKFYLVSASEFVEMFVGVGAARVRDLFETAAKSPPAVIFIDELDAVGRRRGSGIGGGHDEREHTLNQLLVSIDGFEQGDRVVVIAATNRPDILDQALVRPGRFDRRIKIPPLGREERIDTLVIHTKNKQLAGDVSLAEMADRTDGFNGSELENLANEAAMLAVRRACRQDGGSPAVRRADMLEAIRPIEANRRQFTKLDAVLIESATQLSEPAGKAIVRLALADGTVTAGEVIWADASFVKLRGAGDNGDSIIPKRQIRRIEVLDGTESVDRGDLATDVWAGRHPDLA
jgi:cell division protease FtsH